MDVSAAMSWLGIPSPTSIPKVILISQVLNGYWLGKIMGF